MIVQAVVVDTSLGILPQFIRYRWSDGHVRRRRHAGR